TFLDGVDVVLDGLDFFQFDIRRSLFNTARSMGVPVITAGPLGFSSALLVFAPDGMGFDDYFDVGGNLPDESKYLRFAMGLAPRPTHIGYMDLT
ncbi:ThiF family adenylyltransferase, partial [Escherichia coli]|uniref:ThiF family adenylyltransferase n=1 Tax=Escherichia coli TaxID=562 RepID=UPI00307B0D00